MTDAWAAPLAAISANGPALDVPGVLAVRPGYRLVDGWPSTTPAVVVLVESDAVTLPATLDGVPVDVRVASPRDRLRLEDPARYAVTDAADPETGGVAEFPDEFAPVASGASASTASAASATSAASAASAGRPGAASATDPTVPAGFRRVAPVPGAFDRSALDPRASSKPELPYSGPDGVALTPIEDTVTLRLSASPDSGWGTLSSFLGATTSTLTVAMYDFTSAHVLAAVEQAATGRTLDLVLDHPAKNPTADQTDEQTVAALATSLGSGFTQAWALERMDPKATAWVYPNAYHIKVAVQDSRTFWLSSGNWNDSNEPDIDPVANPGDGAEARTRDRDWHLVVEHAGLANTFEEYIAHDLEVAAAHNAPAATTAVEALLRPAVESPPFAEFFAAGTVTGRMRITPLLTPDPGVYVDAVRALIESATTTLHMQFQYIKLPRTVDASTQPFADLVDAVIARQKAGVEVRIIMSQWETAASLEQLQARGLDLATGVRIQPNVHNKGIVVDGRAVLVSSQNWSGDGVLHNRDAGLIVEHPDVAAYFARIFAHDWTHLAAARTTP